MSFVAMGSSYSLRKAGSQGLLGPSIPGPSRAFHATGGAPCIKTVTVGFSHPRSCSVDPKKVRKLSAEHTHIFPVALLVVFAIGLRDILILATYASMLAEGTDPIMDSCQLLLSAVLC
ncbi:hypothetical protein NA56DRAFT_751439 [Hyaloscypha hepaticicola]|uniref:Uncharacterized protein n=1 Tax=Hyaloscypha hepaticicola TaxID=2082293 RepID=A0A2J6PWS8_9HELO|nr:hypothetical protein NA56DRAFT_751439 [Hyaloscypha hepaticicola]